MDPNIKLLIIHSFIYINIDIVYFIKVIRKIFEEGQHWRTINTIFLMLI